MYRVPYIRNQRPITYNNNYPLNRDNRFIGGGFAVPFLLGGLTGGLLAPAFYPRPYPYYGPYPVPYRPYYY